MFNMKYFVIGLLIGIVSFIPGISGGTILYLAGEFNNFTLYLTNFKKYYPYLLLLLLGGFTGIITFAKVIEFLFRYYPLAIKLFFGYLVLFSLPSFIKKEKIKFSFFPFIIAFIFLILISLKVPSFPLVINNIPLTLSFIIFFTLCGFLDGFITIIPGISGSMIMMILGPYYLYKSICAQVISKPILFIPLIFYFLGDFIGICLGAKFTNRFINKYPKLSHSFILGFIVASILIIIPYTEIYKLSGLIILSLAYLIYQIIFLKD